MMSSSFSSYTPKNVSDCEVKPKFWDDDIKMDVWFAPFRSRDLNPFNYDNKMMFWKDNINYFCAQTKQCYFSLNCLKQFFARHEKTPSCLATVLESMIREGIIQNLSDFECAATNNTWMSWAADKLISNPFKWSLRKLVDIIGSPNVEVDENTEYIHLNALKEQSENLFKLVDGAKDIFTFDTIKELYKKKLNTCVDLKVIKLLVHFLELDGKAKVFFENKYCRTHLIKFKSDSQTVPQFNEAEISIYILQKKEESLINQLRTFESEKENLQTEVKKYLKQKMKNMARNALRKQKELEKRISKLSGVLENIQSLLYKVQDTEADSEILQSYKVGADALKSRLHKSGLNLDNVDHTMDEIEKALDLHSDIQETLGQTVIPQNEAALEQELAELLLNDVPSIPPESPSFTGKETEKSYVEINEFPEIPSTLSNYVPQNEWNRVEF